MKKILILTTELTGYGHKTVSDAIRYNFKKYRDMKVKCIEAFSLGGKAAVTSTKIYNKSVNANMWRLLYIATAINAKLVGFLMGINMEKRLLKHIKDFQPDFILSVQPMYVKSTAYVLKKNKIDVPFGVLITDISSFHYIWIDKKPDIYFCPTEETKELSLHYGIKPDKIRLVKYPISAQYTSQSVINRKVYVDSEPLKVLIISGGEGIMNFKKMALDVLTNFNSEVTIVTGKNKKVKEELEESLGKDYKGRLHIKGFVKNLSELYISHHIAVIRASPSVMFEVAKCNIPAIIVSFIKGQESKNTTYAQQHKIAVMSLNKDQLVDTIKELIAHKGKGLMELKDHQKAYISSIAYDNIEDLIYEYVATGSKKTHLRFLEK